MVGGGQRITELPKDYKIHGGKGRAGARVNKYLAIVFAI